MRYGIDPVRIRPQTRLRDILPVQTSAWKGWKELGASLGVKLRPLEHPRWLLIMAMCLGLSVVALSFAVMSRQLIPRDSKWAIVCVVAICLAGIFTPWLLLRTTRYRYAVHIPRGYETVGEVSSLLMHEAVDDLANGKEQWWTHEVWEVIRCIVAKSANIPPAWVTKESKFNSGELV